MARGGTASKHLPQDVEGSLQPSSTQAPQGVGRDSNGG
jgi:hypothetical protein